MLEKKRLRTTLIAAVLTAACFAPGAVPTYGQSVLGFPLQPSSFQQAAPRAFGDRSNSWAQGMIWWHNNLYVGTSREAICTSLYGIYTYIAVPALGKPAADIFLPYPPHDPDISCVADGADLSLQAEIWRWSPITSTWQRVFQSPATLDNPGPGAPAPPRTGKKLPYDIAIRSFVAHTEADGTESLYATGVNSTILWDRTQLPPPRILRTTDGLNFTPIPQAKGTFFGELPFNPDHSTFRSAASYGGKLFALCGPVFGQGTLIASATPAQGNDTWFLAGPAGLLFYELEVFNGWLYLGGFDPTNGYAVFKTKAQGPPPYQLITVVPPGAGLTVRPSKSVVSMHVYFGRLYVGTAAQTEMVRINADDTWDLVVGSPRMAATANGMEWKYPTSNLDAGFGHTLNDHAWQMDDPYRYQYVGTYNASTGSRLDPVNGPLLRHNMGAHLYQTPDGTYYTPITTTGFSSQGDPRGGIFDYGIRTMASTPYGAFLGTANDFYGLAIFRATKRPSPAVESPGRLEVEATKNGGSLLSWLASRTATTYRIWRAEINAIYVRDDLNFEGWNGVSGNKIPDTYVGPYSQIGTSSTLTFLDTGVKTGKRYMYYVTGVNQQSVVSEPSSLTTFPRLLPSATFAELLSLMTTLDSRQRFKPTDIHGTAVRAQILQSQASAAACQIGTAISQLNGQTAAKSLLDPESVDVEILINKVVRRLQLFNQFPEQVTSDEFCK